MGTVADVNYGFKGEVTSAQTPLVLGKGALYSVVGGGLSAAPGGAGDRSVTVTPGIAWGDGVLSIWNASGTVNAAANSTGQTRWDTLVIRRHWQPTSTPRGTATLMLLTGGAQKAIAATRKTDRGVTDSDQPIALVPIAPGSAVAGAPVGIRCWSGAGGGLVGENVEALQYLADLGTTVRVGAGRYTYMLDSTGSPYWRPEFTSGPARANYTIGTADIGPLGTWATLSIPDPGFPYFVEASAGGEWTQVSGRHDFAIRVGSPTGAPIATAINLPAGGGFKSMRTPIASGADLNTPFTGTLMLYAVAYRVGASGAGRFTSGTGHLVARVVPA